MCLVSDVVHRPHDDSLMYVFGCNFMLQYNDYPPKYTRLTLIKTLIRFELFFIVQYIHDMIPCSTIRDKILHTHQLFKILILNMHAASAMQTICNMLYTCILNFKVYINLYLFYFLFIYFLLTYPHSSFWAHKFKD